MARLVKGKVTMQDYLQAQNDSQGWCIECKDWTHDMCEPDARCYECPDCQRPTVYGAEEALFLDLIEVIEEETKNHA